MSQNDKYELSNVDLDKALGHYGPSYGGTYSKDQLPRPADKFYIVNMENHTGGGT